MLSKFAFYVERSLIETVLVALADDTAKQLGYAFDGFTLPKKLALKPVELRQITEASYPLIHWDLKAFGDGTVDQMIKDAPNGHELYVQFPPPTEKQCAEFDVAYLIATPLYTQKVDYWERFCTKIGSGDYYLREEIHTFDEDSQQTVSTPKLSAYPAKSIAGGYRHIGAGVVEKKDTGQWGKWLDKMGNHVGYFAP
jgi:hypothetical protein